MKSSTPATKPSAATKKRRAKFSKKQPSDDDPFPFEIQACNLKVSAFCRRGAGYHKPKPGGPGGFIYEKASSRRSRHREIYKSSSGGREVAAYAVPLGHGEGKVCNYSNEKRSAEARLRRKAVIDAATKNMLQNRRRHDA
jgi:hypothetical protein